MCGWLAKVSHHQRYRPRSVFQTSFSMFMTKSHFNRQHGSSMIEVLITMIVVALGLLGQAALTANSSKANNAALMRSQATLLAYDIIERVRLNRDLAVLGQLNANYAVSGTDPSDSITGTTIQKNELRSWKANIEQALPSGDGYVNVDGGGIVTVKIRWCEVAKGLDCSTNRTEFITMSVI